MSTVKAALNEFLDPIRRNDLKARRQRLGLSRGKLARILNVDPATVFRREQGKLSPLWDYAMRGIEAEAQQAKPVVRDFKSSLDIQSLVPDQHAARGYAYTAEKMHDEREKHARAKRRPPQPAIAKPTKNRDPGKAAIKAAADRAEARSKQSKA
jgi:DNA-binding XRE family transcriptional regulator